MRIAIMPARGGSKRIPGKNTVDFCGAPLMAHSLRAAKRSCLFDLIHVSTEDAEVAAVAAKEGCAPDFLRDPALADDLTPLMPVLKWVLDKYADLGRRFTTVCLLMPTAPLITADDLHEACELFESAGAHRPVLAAARFPCPVEWAFRLDQRGTLIPLQPTMALVRSQDLPTAYYDAGAYIFYTAASVRAHPAPLPDYIAHIIPRHRAVDIDDLDDLVLAERLFRGQPPAP